METDMKRIKVCAAVAIGVWLLGASLLAHQVTYKGTVVSTEKAVVKVTVIDEKTKKPLEINFKVDKDTKILRGDTVVTLTEAKILKGEKIAVTTDHDFDEDLALVIRLDPKK
jgi:hypothetical protein